MPFSLVKTSHFTRTKDWWWIVRPWSDGAVSWSQAFLYGCQGAGGDFSKIHYWYIYTYSYIPIHHPRLSSPWFDNGCRDANRLDQKKKLLFPVTRCLLVFWLAPKNFIGLFSLEKKLEICIILFFNTCLIFLNKQNTQNNRKLNLKW